MKIKNKNEIQKFSNQLKDLEKFLKIYDIELIKYTTKETFEMGIRIGKNDQFVDIHFPNILIVEP